MRVNAKSIIETLKILTFVFIFILNPMEMLLVRLWV